jgi:hypothetical protein
MAWRYQKPIEMEGASNSTEGNTVDAQVIHSSLYRSQKEIRPRINATAMGT